MGGMKFYGGPILYFILYIAIFFSLLVWIDSGYPLPSRLSSLRATRGQDDSTTASRQAPDVAEEKQRVLAPSNNDPLRVLGISKQFARSKVKAVDGVTFGVGGETVGLLGPNGAGKTTTFNMIRMCLSSSLLSRSFSDANAVRRQVEGSSPMQATCKLTDSQFAKTPTVLESGLDCALNSRPLILN